MLNDEFLDDDLPIKRGAEDSGLSVLFTKSRGLAIAHIMCGFVIILLDIAALGTSMQALLSSIHPDGDGGGLIVMGLSYLGLGPLISHFPPLQVILTILVLICVCEAVTQLVQNKIGLKIKSKMIDGKQGTYRAEEVPEKELAMDEVESVLKAFEFAFFCIVVIIALSFLSVALSLALVVAGVILVGLTVFSQRTRAKRRARLATRRREYAAAIRKPGRGDEELDGLRAAYFDESLAFKRGNARTAASLGVLQSAVLIALVVVISYMQFSAAVLALPIVIVLSVRRFISNGRAAGAKLAKVLERRGFWSNLEGEGLTLSETNEKT